MKLQKEGQLLASKTFIHTEDDGRTWDDMGFPEEGVYLHPYMPVRSTKLVQFKPPHSRNLEFVLILRTFQCYSMHNDRPTHSRYSMTRPKLESVDVEYVETEDFAEEEELVTMEGDEVYYEQEIGEEVIHAEDGTRVIPMQQHVLQHVIAGKLEQNIDFISKRYSSTKSRRPKTYAVVKRTDANRESGI